MSDGYIDRNAQRVYHILQRACEIKHLTDGMSYESFIENSLLVDATLYKLMVIGEAIRAMDDSFRVAHPDLPWKSIVGMRNILVHQYEDVDYSIIWDVITRELPAWTFRLEEVYLNFDFPDDFDPPPVPR